MRSGTTGAAAGAAVVVVDSGAGLDGTGTDPAVARSVADEIAAAGGRAVAGDQDVSTADDGDDLAALPAALPARLDAVVNNAGIAISGPVECVPLEELRRQLEVNLVGQVDSGNP